MGAVVVRYRTHPERADENADLVRAVYAELNAGNHPGFRYATYRLDDGTSFVHVAELDDGVPNPLDASPAFQAFVADIAERCVEGPAAMRGEPVGSHPA